MKTVDLLVTMMLLGLLGGAVAWKVPKMVGSFQDKMAESRAEDAIVNALATDPVFQERMIERGTPLFEDAVLRIAPFALLGNVRLLDFNGLILENVKGITQTKGIVFVAYTNGDYTMLGTYGDLKDFFNT